MSADRLRVMLVDDHEVVRDGVKTVKNYVSTILSKLEVARRAEAAAYLARKTATPGT